MKLIAFIFFLLIAGCASTLPLPTTEDIELFRGSEPGVTLESLKNARTVYTAKCSGCHGLFLPENYRPDEWPKIISGMSDKAKLSPHEFEKIRLYLTLYSMKNTASLPDSLLGKVGIELETN